MPDNPNKILVLVVLELELSVIRMVQGVPDAPG
jgi:hypothetical protein